MDPNQLGGNCRF
jgi:hypothetical protein